MINEIATMSNWSKSHKRQNLQNSPYSEYSHLTIPRYQHRSKWLQFALNVSPTVESEQFSDCCVFAFIAWRPCVKCMLLQIG